MKPRSTLISCLLAVGVAWATATWGVGGEGIFSGTSCSTLTTPATGRSWCGDPTDSTWKVWTGSAWAPVNPATGVSTSLVVATACTLTFTSGRLTAATGTCP